LKAVGAGAAALASVGNLMGAERKTVGKPNILMILVDDLGYGDLSSYGATDLKTPHIDRLVSAGMRFDNFYANCPVCSPTRAALLSGCYPDMAGVPGVVRTHITNSWGCLAPHAELLPKLLKKEGRFANRPYHTAIIGKWHLGLDSPNTPNERGGYGGRAYYAARYGDYKLVQNSPFEPMELYNLKDDPREQKPLGRKNKMYQKLFTALRNHIIEAGAVPWEKYPVQFDRS